MPKLMQTIIIIIVIFKKQNKITAIQRFPHIALLKLWNVILT